MSTLAQRLCHDIVEPILKHPSTDAEPIKSTSKLNSSLNLKRNPKSSRSVHIENRPTTRKNVTGGTTITKSRTSIYKTNLTETGVNTLVSGPLKCDNNCVTLVRKRDLQSSCKCGQKRKNVKGSTKSIQTLNKINYCITDKAVAHCVETANCGTQFIDKANRYKANEFIGKANTYKDTDAIKPIKTQARDNFGAKVHHSHCPYFAKESLNNPMQSRVPALRYVGAKHWAFSRYPTRGPDF